MMPPTYSAAEEPTDGLLGCIVQLVRSVYELTRRST